jgi:hypothetical protein
MTELAHAPADRYGDQLQLDIALSGVSSAEAPVDISTDVVSSPAYQHLVEMRDAAYADRRSGARAIAQAAFAALRAGEITEAEHAQLFEGRPPVPGQPRFEDYSTERPAREPDWAERASGEAVRHPWDDDA